MKNLLIVIIIFFTLSVQAKHGDSLTSFNGVTAFDNNERISRNSILAEKYGGFECYEYVIRYYNKVYNLNLYNYIQPSIERGGYKVYFAKDLYRSNGKVSKDGRLIMLKNPKLEVGDIIVYGGGRVGHVAIYIGNGNEIGQNISPVIRKVGYFKGIVRCIK